MADEVGKVMQGIASDLQRQQGGTNAGVDGDYKANTATHQGKGPDLSGHASAKGGK